MKCLFPSSLVRVALRVPTEERVTGVDARTTGGSWSAVTVYVLAVVASDKPVGSQSVTGHCTFYRTRTDILPVRGTGWG